MFFFFFITTPDYGTCLLGCVFLTWAFLLKFLRCNEVGRNEFCQYTSRRIPV